MGKKMDHVQQDLMNRDHEALNDWMQSLMVEILSLQFGVSLQDAKKVTETDLKDIDC